MHALIIGMINLHIKFEVPSYTHSKDDWDRKIWKWFAWPDHAPFIGGLSCMSQHLLGSTYLLNFMSFPPVTTIWKAIQTVANGVVWGRSLEIAAFDW